MEGAKGKTNSNLKTGLRAPQAATHSMGGKVKGWHSRALWGNKKRRCSKKKTKGGVKRRKAAEGSRKGKWRRNLQSGLPGSLNQIGTEYHAFNPSRSPSYSSKKRGGGNDKN